MIIRMGLGIAVEHRDSTKAIGKEFRHIIIAADIGGNIAITVSKSDFPFYRCFPVDSLQNYQSLLQQKLQL